MKKLTLAGAALAAAAAALVPAGMAGAEPDEPRYTRLAYSQLYNADRFLYTREVSAPKTGWVDVNVKCFALDGFKWDGFDPARSATVTVGRPEDGRLGPPREGSAERTFRCDGKPHSAKTVGVPRQGFIKAEVAMDGEGGAAISLWGGR
jgi:hypothetical protein